MIAIVYMSRLGRLSILLLSVLFFITFFVLVLPSLPSFPNSPSDFGWVIPTWNLPGPLMFILTYRIHALRVIREKALGKKLIFEIPFWVKFWLYTSLAIGFFTISYTCAAIALGMIPLFYPATLGGFLVYILWASLIFSTVSLTQLSYKRKFAKIIDEEREKEKKLFYVTSAVFLVFTAYPSITALFPSI